MERCNNLDYFKGKSVILFSLPGPLHQLVQHINYQILKKMYVISLEGIDEIYCMSVNDAFDECMGEKPEVRKRKSHT